MEGISYTFLERFLEKFVFCLELLAFLQVAMAGGCFQDPLGAKQALGDTE
jgi:hypothetical protein